MSGVRQKKRSKQVAESTAVAGSQNGRSADKHPAALQVELPPLPPELFINRELSWLEFNRRVLDEARDSSLPLLERVKFIAITASNLDEFFMIRVANLKRKLTAGIADLGPDGRTPGELASVLMDRVQKFLEEQATLFCGELMPLLAAKDIKVLKLSELDASKVESLNGRFQREMFPVLTPQAVDRARRFPHVSNQSLNLIVVLRTPDTGYRYARIKIPAVLQRLVPVEPVTAQRGDTTSSHSFVWLEDLVAENLGQLFPGNEIVASYPFRVIRDSDIELDDDEDQTRDLLLAMEEHLSQRTFGSVVMLLLDISMPDEVRRWLMEQLHVSDRDVFVVDGPLDLESLFELAKIDRPDLKDGAFLPAPLGRLPEPTTPEAEAFNWPTEDVFAAVRVRDVLLHHPYQSFGVVLDFLRTAALDHNVMAMKQTLYRIGKDSPLIPALIEARDEDTQVAVLMEVKARFDEENNIAWAHELEHNGVHVAYGLAGLKTHCKMLLVVRREGDELRRYVHLSTGNYNAGTARTYEDIGLLTANDEIAADVSELFNVITGFSRQATYRKLWVAPFHLRDRFIERIAREVDVHRRTGKGRLIFKMNSLVDRDTIRALYAASQAGVEIDLIVRGICCLRPGVPGWSETIRVRSVVGRFLEHSRIYYFGNGGNDEIYLSSADLMERNLDRRIEVAFPIEDEVNKRHIRDVVLASYLRDDANARILRPDGTYEPVCSEVGSAELDVHRAFIKLYQLPLS